MFRSRYLPWNLLEPRPGEFVDRERHPALDFVAFVREAHTAGLLVSIRAGPYITAEHDFGGYPWWLLAHYDRSENRSSTFRTTATWFTSLVDKCVLWGVIHVNLPTMILRRSQNQ